MLARFDLACVPYLVLIGCWMSNLDLQADKARIPCHFREVPSNDIWEVRRRSGSAPTPHILAAIAENEQWLSSDGIDLSKAIVEVVPVPDTWMSRALQT
jgi:hypothetical protein